MKTFGNAAISINNPDSPFTELFSVLKKYSNAKDDTTILAYSADELAQIDQHSNNAIETLLRGLQDIGQVIAAISIDEVEILSARTFGSFISVVCNLVEALYLMRQDCN